MSDKNIQYANPILPPRPEDVEYLEKEKKRDGTGSDVWGDFVPEDPPVKPTTRYDRSMTSRMFSIIRNEERVIASVDQAGTHAIIKDEPSPQKLAEMKERQAKNKARTDADEVRLAQIIVKCKTRIDLALTLKNTIEGPDVGLALVAKKYAEKELTKGTFKDLHTSRRKLQDAISKSVLRLIDANQ